MKRLALALLLSSVVVSGAVAESCKDTAAGKKLQRHGSREEARRRRAYQLHEEV